ncbi:CotH kinase family protein [Pseudobacteroides cellulosolvens]|uniref:Spore coat protein CotH n=1 Tax=Pseudobacteroides cellulosolvens ATCC 35603 = DSM 2933 TaxID=398512 RepID=A0A0L6JTV1_9FIRM|nr:CotH kinase family protein [Pseudobacteroides cellulosolvens]KNY29266.1 Spore coat protein CotH [Pseudobacteroides cellulosolvens ATCC 35603 = DSM 2933]
MRKFFKGIAISMCLVVSFVCVNPIGVKAADESVVRPAGWTEETHGKKADPNYSVAFPDDKVNRIDITISSSNYKSMESDLKKVNTLDGENPIYVPATVKFNDNTWTNVGVRYKGQSSLLRPQLSRDHKYPLHLKFDEFEGQYPDIKDQRFYGFQHLVLSNNWFDSSFVRDKVTSDIFRSAGIPTACGSFYRVFIDTGSGPVYWGLYTVFEDPSDEMLNTQFANGDGNLYKGQTATGADLTTFNKQGYEKKTNEDADDWSDLQALVTALNEPRTDAATWRANLESVFNVNLFLKWLAVNTAITNFDTYGWVTKNHYLYQDLSDNGRMVYVPWDFNLSLTTDPLGILEVDDMGGGFGGFGGFGGGFGGVNGGNNGGFCTEVASLSLDELSNSWPLIRYLMDDPIYKNIYHNEMKAAMSGCFNESTIINRMTQLHELIRPYVVGAEGETSKYSFLTNGTTQFDQGLAEIITLVSDRHKAVSDYLSTVTISPTPVTTSKPTESPTTNTPTNTAATNTPANSAASIEDINNDGVINMADVILMAGAFNTVRGDSIYNSSCDLNNDGTVNMSDIVIIATKFNVIVRH